MGVNSVYLFYEIFHGQKIMHGYFDILMYTYLLFIDVNHFGKNNDFDKKKQTHFKPFQTSI